MIQVTAETEAAFYEGIVQEIKKKNIKRKRIFENISHRSTMWSRTHGDYFAQMLTYI